MKRVFNGSDDGGLFSFGVGGPVGKLEFPIADPGSSLPGEGILWYIDRGPGGAVWEYVSPSDVEEVESL